MKDRGFTLVELLAVITLLGVIALLIVPQVESTLNKSRNKGLEAQKKSILADAKSWAIDNKERLYEDDTSTYSINLGTLKLSGYADYEIINPVTNKCISNDTEVIITKNDKNKLSYDFKSDIKDGTESDCLDKTQKPNTTDSKCFKFNTNTRTIEGYNYGSCPTDVVLPAEIDGIPVEHIGDLAFLPPEHIVLVSLYDSETKKANDELDIIENLSDESKIYNKVQLVSNDKASEYQKQCYKKGSTTTYDMKPITYIMDNTYDKCEIPSSTYLKILNDSPDLGTITGVDFSYSKNLKSIGLGAFMFNKITSINFNGAINLSKVGASAFQNNWIDTVNLDGALKLTKISNGMFSVNTIENITISDKIKTIGYSGFSDNSMKTVDFSNAIRLEEIKDNGFSVNNLTIVEFKNMPNLKKLGHDILSLNSLTRVSLDNLPSLTTISGGTFSDLNSSNARVELLFNNLPKFKEFTYTDDTRPFNGSLFSTVEFKNMDNYEVAQEKFFYFVPIDTLKLNNLKNLKIIKKEAFSGDNIKYLYLPANLQTIERGGFSYNNSSIEVNIEGDKTRFNSNWADIGFPTTVSPK